jgi:hypothetical protein
MRDNKKNNEPNVCHYVSKIKNINDDWNNLHLLKVLYTQRKSIRKYIRILNILFLVLIMSTHSYRVMITVTFSGLLEAKMSINTSLSLSHSLGWVQSMSLLFG